MSRLSWNTASRPTEIDSELIMLRSNPIDEFEVAPLWTEFRLTLSTVTHGQTGLFGARSH